MRNLEASKALKTLAMAYGLNVLERLSSSLDPDRLIEQAGEVLGSQLRDAAAEILQDSDSVLMQDLIDRVYGILDEERIIEVISGPLAESRSTWFKDEASDLLVEGIVDQIDQDDLLEMISQKLAERLALRSS